MIKEKKVKNVQRTVKCLIRRIRHPHSPTCSIKLIIFLLKEVNKLNQASPSSVRSLLFG